MVTKEEYEKAKAELKEVWDDLDNFPTNSPEHRYYNHLIDIVIDYEDMIESEYEDE